MGQEELQLVLGRQEMLGLAEVLRTGHGGAGVRGRGGAVAAPERLARQLAIGHDPLPRNEPLAPFPGMEAAPLQDRQSLAVTSRPIQQRQVGDRQVVALLDERAVGLQEPQPMLRPMAHPQAQLVELVEDAGVSWIRSEGPLVGSQRLAWTVQDVDLGDTEVAMDGRECGVEPCRPPPGADGLPVAPPVVEEVAEAVGRARVAAVPPAGPLKDSDLLEAVGHRPIRSSRAGASEVAAGSTLVAAPCLEPGHGVLEHRPASPVGARACCPVEELQRLFEQPGTGLVVGHIERGLGAARERVPVALEEGPLVKRPDVERVVVEQPSDDDVRPGDVAPAPQDGGSQG